MDHVVYLDYKSQELENIVNHKKDIILRGATGRKLPYNRVSVGDNLYLCNNNGEMLIKAMCTVKQVTFSSKLDTQSSEALVDQFASRTLLQDKALKRFRGKRYITIIEIESVIALTPFSFDKTHFSNMDDWLLVEDINIVKQ